MNLKNDEYLNLVTVNEAAKIVHLCRQKIYQLINDNRIKGFKNDAGKYLILKSSLADYIQSCYTSYATRTTAKEVCAA